MIRKKSSLVLKGKTNMLQFRPLNISDAEKIVDWPKSSQELFYLFPDSQYPLSVEALLKKAEHRFYPSVATLNGALAGYANFIRLETRGTSSIGNVVVNPELRRKGVAFFLVETMTALAFKKFKSTGVQISCFNENTAGLLLYHKLGFVPVDVEVRKNYRKESVALIHMFKYADKQPLISYET